MITRALLAISLTAIALPALAAGPLEVTSRVLVEKRVAAVDGTTQVKAVATSHVVPGDRLTVAVSYRNTGGQPIANLVLANPVPSHLAFRAPAEGSPMPELSVDGRRFGRLAELTVPVAGGGVRPASLDDVVAVRWRLDRPLGAGSSGSFGFRAVLK